MIKLQAKKWLERSKADLRDLIKTQYYDRNDNETMGIIES